MSFRLLVVLLLGLVTITDEISYVIIDLLILYISNFDQGFSIFYVISEFTTRDNDVYNDKVSSRYFPLSLPDDK